MNYNLQITATIVVYEEDLDILKNTVECFLKIPLQKRLFIIDNSAINNLSKTFINDEIEYVFIGENIGFGAGHNRVINKIKNNSKYHLILNPDVTFFPSVIMSLVEEFERRNEVAMIAPRVVFSNGEHQYTCRRYPTIFDLLARRLSVSKRTINIGEYVDTDLSKPFYPDFIHGCFTLFKTEDFVKIKGFDERYFLYMEDVDICRKIDQIGKKKLYYPYVQISHSLQKESSKSFRLFLTHLNSSIKYFKKWGF